MPGKTSRNLAAVCLASSSRPALMSVASWGRQTHVALGFSRRACLSQHAASSYWLLTKCAEIPARHPRYMAWRAMACAHPGRIEEARQCAETFMQGVGGCWSGDPAAGPKDSEDWIVGVGYLRRDEDAERLRVGLRLAGLPA